MEHISEQVENKYILDALHLFHETQWLYNLPVTDILIEESLDAFPKDWLTNLSALSNQELNDFVVNKITKPEWSSSLKIFVEKCKCTNLLTAKNISNPMQLPHNFKIGLSYKKQHEIMHLAELVHKQCSLQGIKLIVDLGAGLGYVCQLLHHLYEYQVLGLEKSEANVNSARNRQKKMYPESLAHVKYTCCDITCDSVETIEKILQREFGANKNVCLIGLHACGDLSVYASKIFINMSAAQCFIMISCCYHKLSISKTVKTDASSREKQYFNHFPLSQNLKNKINKLNYDIGTFLRQPFLRLACQEPADRWFNMSSEAHDVHAFHVLARAVLQLYAATNGFLLKKRVQKATRKSQCFDFQTYLKDSFLRYTLELPDEGNIQERNGIRDFETHERKIMELWEKHRQKLKTAEIYTGLQLLLQAPAESLVLQDRLYWMQEQGLDATIIPVMNNNLSPRSYAIVSQKR